MGYYLIYNNKIEELVC